ncbi:MAG: 3-deoxy-7-phosphoheptulonate synthase, partial [Planctomycetes bacterium]|nr:3-deoxy-7-phosphoheptulonate synthase [Planctomycetota bacterium]
MKDNWSPASWKKRPIAQQVRYPDADALRDAIERLVQLPPLVSSWEVETLKQQLGEAAQGKRFLLQGGDCSETFNDCRSSVIESLRA